MTDFLDTALMTADISAGDTLTVKLNASGLSSIDKAGITKCEMLHD